MIRIKMFSRIILFKLPKNKQKLMKVKPNKVRNSKYT